MARSPPSILAPPEARPDERGADLEEVRLAAGAGFSRLAHGSMNSIVMAERGGKRFELQDAARPFGQDDAASAARTLDRYQVCRFG